MSPLDSLYEALARIVNYQVESGRLPTSRTMDRVTYWMEAACSGECEDSFCIPAQVTVCGKDSTGASISVDFDGTVGELIETYSYLFN